MSVDTLKPRPRCRTPRTALAAAAVLAALSGAPAFAANYATGGTGAYRDEILWLTWGAGQNGTAGEALVNGSSTSATIALTPTRTLEVSCTLQDITGGGVVGGGLVSYRPGTYSGDPLDDLYNIGGTGAANALVSGISTVTAGETKNFNVVCTAVRDGVPYQIPGLVMADAESLESTGTVEVPSEFLQGTADGNWNVVEMLRVPGRTYYARKTNSGGLQSLRFGPGGQGSGTSPGAVTFLDFNSTAYAPGSEAVQMGFSIRGGGRTAIAIGLLVPKADFGDAPASYGSASHLIGSLVPVADGLAADGVSVNINAGTFPLGGLAPPAAGFIGSTGPDGESASQHSIDADGDDLNGSAGPAEEDGWPVGYTLEVTRAGQILAEPIVCSGTGTVAGWIDFSMDGAFSADERAEAPCVGGTALLEWTLPDTLVPGRSYVRLRYASDPAQVLDAVGDADDGEVEDHLVTFVVPVADLRIEKTTPASEFESGAQASYTVVVTNDGPADADGAIVSDDWTSAPGLDCSGGTLACAASGTAGTQCPVETDPDALAAGIEIPVLPAGGIVTLTLTCTVTATGL